MLSQSTLHIDELAADEKKLNEYLDNVFSEYFAGNSSNIKRIRAEILSNLFNRLSIEKFNTLCSYRKNRLYFDFDFIYLLTIVPGGTEDAIYENFKDSLPDFLNTSTGFNITGFCRITDFLTEEQKNSAYRSVKEKLLESFAAADSYKRLSILISLEKVLSQEAWIDFITSASLSNVTEDINDLNTLKALYNNINQDKFTREIHLDVDIRYYNNKNFLYKISIDEKKNITKNNNKRIWRSG